MQNILDNVWSSAISLFIVGLGFTDILKKNYYEKIQEKLIKLLLKMLNRSTKGVKHRQTIVILQDLLFKGANMQRKPNHICLLNILLIYLDKGSIPYQIMFTDLIQSRVSQISVKEMHISFLYGGLLKTSCTLQNRHYASIVRNHYGY